MAADPLSTRGHVLACVQFTEVFQDQLLEDPPSASAPIDSRRRHLALEREADRLCRSCPLLLPCLYRAVVDHDVSGYVAGTTQRQRSEIRNRLCLTVEPEDFDTLAGVTRHHRQVDHDEVVRLRNASPQESLEQLARRLGCSLSTVKRHLRSERQGFPVRELLSEPRPTAAQVLLACRQVTGFGSRQQETAA